MTGSEKAPQRPLRLPEAAAPPSTANNFNALRLLFALLVAVYHAVALPGIDGWKSAEAALSIGAEVGVQGFFVLSGYLVYGSLVRSDSIALYAEKRVRRLYPAYAVVVAASVAGALLFSSEARSDLGGTFHYFIANITFFNFLGPNLPGVFELNRFTETNGALWTLKIEVMFYVLLPALAWLLRASGRARWAVIAMIYVAAEAWRIGFEQMGQADLSSPYFEMSRQLPGQMSFFITGIALASSDFSRRLLDRAAVAGAILFALSLLAPFAEPARAIGLGAVAVWMGRAAPKGFDAARFGDLSYGLYIIHFPIIQAFVAAGLFGSPAVGLAMSALAAFTGAFLLWRYVERPALRSDSAYRTAH